MMNLPKCEYCQRPMRTPNETLADLPGTVVRASPTDCRPCRKDGTPRRRLRAPSLRDTVEPPRDGWQEDAACDGAPLELFTTNSRELQVQTLLTFCARCPVRAECEQDAIRNGDYKFTIRGNRMRTKPSYITAWIPPATRSCGTRTGYNRHRRNKEEPCTPCRLAQASKRRADTD